MSSPIVIATVEGCGLILLQVESGFLDPENRVNSAGRIALAFFRCGSADRTQIIGVASDIDWWDGEHSVVGEPELLQALHLTRQTDIPRRYRAEDEAVLCEALTRGGAIMPPHASDPA